MKKLSNMQINAFLPTRTTDFIKALDYANRGIMDCDKSDKKCLSDFYEVKSGILRALGRKEQSDDCMKRAMELRNGLNLVLKTLL